MLTWTEFNNSIPKFLADLAESIQQNRIEQQLLNACSTEAKNIIWHNKLKIQIIIGLTDIQLEPRLLLFCRTDAWINTSNKNVCDIRIGINITHPDFSHLECLSNFLLACRGKIASFWNESQREDIFKGLQVNSYVATRIALQNLLQIEKFDRLSLHDDENIREVLLCEQKLPINRLEIIFHPGDELPRMFFPEMMIELDGKPNESLFRQEYERSLTFGTDDEFYVYLLPQVFVELIANSLASRLPFLVEDLYDPRLLILIWEFTDWFDLIWRAASPLREN